MSDRSAIEWTDASYNPIRARVWEIQDDGSGKERIGWHCEHASEGCRFCYAEGFNLRLGTGREYKPGEVYDPEREGYHNGEVKLFLDEKTLLLPLRWKKPRKIFVCSMTDAFADFVPDEWLDKMFAVMALCPQHTFQVLTKRAERMRRYFTDPIQCTSWTIPRLALIENEMQMIEAAMPHARRTGRLIGDKWPLPNVWLGVSAEDQDRWDERGEHLQNTPAAVRFVSCEPLLGGIRFHPCRYCNHPGNVIEWPCSACKGRRFEIPDWVIVGGESGPKARPMHPHWARSLRDQCTIAGASFFFKQWGEWAPGVRPGFCADIAFDRRGEQAGHIRSLDEMEAPAGMSRIGKKSAGRLLDGREHNEFPQVSA